MDTLKNFINGRFVPAQTNLNLEVKNPATGETLAAIPDSEASEVDAAIAAAEKAQPAWAATPAIARAGVLREIAARIRQNANSLAATITREQGKVLPLALVEVSFTADYLDYMAEWARRIEGEVIQSDRATEKIFLMRKPLGVIAGILPWNFPFFLIARKLAPALVTGNTIVIKPSEETPINAHQFFELLAQTSIPAGVANLVFGGGAVTGAALTASPKVDMISFTGSVHAGSLIMSAAAANITKVNLELGGKAPAIVLKDADLDLAVKAIHASRVINAGQVCNCAERVYVQREVADAFTEKLVAAMQASKYGDPFAEGMDYGPLINQAGFEKVESLVASARAAGAEVLTGGRRADRKGGYYYEPTVVAGCSQAMDIIQQEVFGPVAPIVTVDSPEEAISLANDSDYGLTSSIYTKDVSLAMRLIDGLQFGETYVNRENFEAMQGYHAGWRKSGIGGADGKHGLYEYTASQVVYLNY